MSQSESVNLGFLFGKASCFYSVVPCRPLTPFIFVLPINSDPDADFDLRDALYSDGRFLRSLYDALSEDGVLVVQIGKSPANGEPAGTMGPGRYRTSLIGQLERLGFKSMHIYHEVRVYVFFRFLCAVCQVASLTRDHDRPTAACFILGTIWLPQNQRGVVGNGTRTKLSFR